MTRYDHSTCKGCPATIVWAKTVKGQRMPLDAVRDDVSRTWVPAQVDDGNVENTGDSTWGPNGIRLPVVRVLRAGELEQTSLAPRWRSHFATCPKSTEFSRRRSRSGARASGRGREWDR